MKEEKFEIFVSTDIESDGPIPGEYSMLSFGSVAYLVDGQEVSRFSRNLDTLPDAKQHPDTMKWWASQKAAWESCRKDTVSPKEGMQDYYRWLKDLQKYGKITFVAYPVTFDYMFIHWYLVKFVGDNPMGISGLDMKTLAMSLLNRPFREIGKSNMPKEWFPPHLPHTHVAVEDAAEQGKLFLSMYKEMKENFKKKKV